MIPRSRALPEGSAQFENDNDFSSRKDAKAQRKEETAPTGLEDTEKEISRTQAQVLVPGLNEPLMLRHAVMVWA